MVDINTSKLGSGNMDQSFFGRMNEGSSDQQGQRVLGANPEQGNQFNTMSREASRNMYQSVIRPSSWKSALGLAPAAETNNYRYDGGDYAADGSVRTRTARSGGELIAPNGMNDGYSFNSAGNTSFGGNEKTYNWNYNNAKNADGTANDTTIARAATTGVQSQDSTGNSTAQSGFNRSNSANFGESGSKEWEGLGSGGYKDEGTFRADLANPSSNIRFNNQVNSQLAGSAQAKYSSSTDGGNTYATSEDGSISPSGQIGETLFRAFFNGHTLIPGLAKTPLMKYNPMEYLSQAVGRLASNYTLINNQQTDTTAKAGLQASAGMDMSGAGSAGIDRTTGANAKTQAVGMGGAAASTTDVGINQKARMNLADNSEGFANMSSELQGATNTKLAESQVLKKNFMKWNPEAPQYEADASSQHVQDVGLQNNAGIKNANVMAAQGVPNGWADSHIDPNIMANFAELKQRFPGIYGNYADANDYATREYYRLNPQTSITMNQNATVDNTSQAQSAIRSSTNDALNYQKVGNQDVSMGGAITLSGEGGANLSNGVALTTNQQDGVNRNPFSGAYASRATPTSTVDLKLNSELNAALTGAGAQAEAVNDLKFKFNDTEYGATLKLQAQRFINNLEEQLPTTRDSEQVINALRSNPELTALFNANTSPQTTINAILKYDNTAKTLSSELKSSTDNTNYKKAQVYDPTPDKPNSGDEMALANILGNVKQIQKGKLYDIGITDQVDYNTDYKLPTPITNLSNEYLADNKTYSQQLKNDQYFYADGGNQIYDSLANEAINRKYGLQKNFDTTQTDQYLNQINELIANGQGLENYSVDDLKAVSNLLTQARSEYADPARQQYQQQLQAKNNFDTTIKPALTNTINTLTENLTNTPETDTAGRAKIQEQLDATKKQLQDATVEQPWQNKQGDSYYLPQTQTINPIFNYYINRKGFYGDPRSMDPANVNMLEKYYNYDNWGYGQQVRDEEVDDYGMIPGYNEGSGTKRLDPNNPGKYLTDSRELTPEEFAQAQYVGANPNQTMSDFLGMGEVDPYKEKIISRATGDTYRVRWHGWHQWAPAYANVDVGKEEYDARVAQIANLNKQTVTGGVNKYTNPTEAAAYQALINQQIQAELAKNKYRPV